MFVLQKDHVNSLLQTGKVVMHKMTYFDMAWECRVGNIRTNHRR